MLNELISYLDLPDSDYWYDEGSCIARNILNQKPEIFLEQILNEWKQWSPRRQEHLAYILGEGESDKEHRLIIEMLNCESEGVQLRARESLADYEQS